MGQIYRTSKANLEGHEMRHMTSAAVSAGKGSQEHRWREGYAFGVGISPGMEEATGWPSTQELGQVAEQHRLSLEAHVAVQAVRRNGWASRILKKKSGESEQRQKVEE